MNRIVTHKHLKKQFDIFDRTEELDDLFLELEYSTLLLPVNIEGNSVTFPLIDFEGKKYAPVFTDFHEFNKVGFDGDFTLKSYEFEFYLELVDERIDGIIIDIEGERFPITREFRDFFNPNYIMDYDPQVFTLKEIKRIRDSVNNAELEEFLKDESNHWDYENLMELLLKSDLFVVGLSEEDLSHKAQDGVISMHGMTRLPQATHSWYTETYALLYSSEKEIWPKNNPMHPYPQLVNFPELIYRALLDDLDGIILKENSQNIIIPRDFLISFFKDFSCPNIDKYDDYAFVMQVGE